MNKIKPYIVVPNLIEQPTWGGDYIAKLKNITTEKVSGKKLGQSYELYQHTNLSLKKSSLHNPSLELGNPTKPQNAKPLHQENPLKLSSLISQNPTQTLGKKAFKQIGPSMQVLIKLTQAKGNSYQIHTNKKTAKWLPKPESWYYFEPGLLTLGIKSKTNWNDYKKTCVLISQKSQEISQEIKSQKISLANGRKQIDSLIKKAKPEKFVNLIHAKRHQIIDLSPCAVHHSWEESPHYPQGNIVYEVQKNVYDPVSTIRAFDKGNIQDDGSVRPVQVNDYFQYIDRSKKANLPNAYLKKPKILKRTSTHTIKQIFSTPNYSMQQLKFANHLNNKFTQTTNSFHHLFVKQGSIKLTAQSLSWTVTQGYSIFIPAATGRYRLDSHKHSWATILKTYV